MARRKHSNGQVYHSVFGQAFYDNLATLVDEQMAELMKDPEFREAVEDFSVRMFDALSAAAKRHMKRKQRKIR